MSSSLELATSCLVRIHAATQYTFFILALGSDEGPWNHSFRFEQSVFSSTPILALTSP